MRGIENRQKRLVEPKTQPIRKSLNVKLINKKLRRIKKDGEQRASQPR